MKAHFRLGACLLAVILAAGGTLLGAPQRKRDVRGRETTIHGRLGDIHSFMTGKVNGDNPTKATQDSFRAGAAAVVETEEGVVVLGSGDKGPARLIVPLAMQHVEVKGKLYERGGMRYMDMASIQVRHGDETPAKTEEHEGASEEPLEAPEPPADELPSEDEPEEP